MWACCRATASRFANSPGYRPIVSTTCLNPASSVPACGAPTLAPKPASSAFWPTSSGCWQPSPDRRDVPDAHLRSGVGVFLAVAPPAPNRDTPCKASRISWPSMSRHGPTGKPAAMLISGHPTITLAQACQLMAHWGFQHRTVLTWIKPPPFGQVSYFRNLTEHVLFGTLCKTMTGRAATYLAAFECPAWRAQRKAGTVL